MNTQPRLQATVAICTYNGAARIGSVFQSLAEQSMDSSQWETLVIDNASSDGSGDVAARFIRDKLGGRGRVVREARPGLSFARARAAAEAGGEIVCFLDDDNVPAQDFVAAAVQAFSSRPRAGALGGKVVANWETTPNPLALAVQDFALAICDRGDKAFKYELNLGPVGAGLCIRTNVLRKIYQTQETASKVLGRTGNGFGGGEDLAIAIRVWQFGWECWYDPALQIQHLLPAGRMEKGYLLRLYEGIGRGQFAVRKLYDWKARSPLSYVIGLKDLCRWLLGKWAGPSAEMRLENPALAGDLHDLQQRLTWGRSTQALLPFWQ